MAGARQEQHHFDLDGGTPALDFVNTVSGMRVTAPRERLLGYDDLVDWAAQAGLLDPRQAERGYAFAREHPRRAADALAQALRAREALHDVVLAAIEGRDPPMAALDTVNGWIADALAHHRLRPAGPGRLEAVLEDDGDPLAFLRPVAADALRVLRDELASGRVHRCAESEVDSCGWLFLDETRNASRRYCSMTVCGNRAKQRRHYERKKGD